MSLEQFLALPEREPDGTRYELSDGELLTLPPPGYRHGVILATLVALLRMTIDRKQFVVAGGDAGFLLNQNPETATVRGADLPVNRREDVGADPPVGWFEGSPLVAIEVISPSSRAQDTERKIGQYLAAGSSEVWVVYPDSERVYLYSAGRREPRIFERGESFNSVLGCPFDVSDMFQI